MGLGRKLLHAIAYSREGRPVRYVEAYIHKSRSGGLAGHISVVGVVRGYRGMGIDRALISTVTRLMLEAGADTIYLYSLPEAVSAYLGMGFIIDRELIRLRISAGDIAGLRA